MFQLELYILVIICSFNIHARLQCTKWWMWKCPHEVAYLFSIAVVIKINPIIVHSPKFFQKILDFISTYRQNVLNFILFVMELGTVSLVVMKVVNYVQKDFVKKILEVVGNVLTKRSVYLSSRYKHLVIILQN